MAPKTRTILDMNAFDGSVVEMAGDALLERRFRFGDEIAEGFARDVEDAIVVLNSRGHGIAALICDSIFSSDGVFSDPPGFLADAVDVVRRAGGLFIADEVQPGFGRTGRNMWGFERHGVAPDLVTMGKSHGKRLSHGRHGRQIAACHGILRRRRIFQ